MQIGSRRLLWPVVAQAGEARRRERPQGGTGGATSQAWLGAPTATFGRWVFSGFSPIRVAPAVFSAFESGILVGTSGALNFAMTGASFETGALVGSLIAAIPTGSGSTVRDSVADAMFGAFGPDTLPDELACGW